MTTPARHEEADAAAVAFQIALTKIGAKSIEDALTLWEDVPVEARPATAARWLQQAVRLVLFNRVRSRALAMAYYRLVRALRTGKTIADAAKDEPPYVRLSDLRQEFNALVESPEIQPTNPPVEPQAPEPDLEPVVEVEPEPSTPEADEESLLDDLIELEELEIEAELERIEREAEAEALEVLANLGTGLASGKISKLDTSKSADEVDAEREEAQAQAGSRQAAAAARLSQNGARAAIFQIGQKDNAVIGWVRLSRTGTPCGFCAMLISRGFTDKSGYYSTQRGTTTTVERRGKNIVDETDMYHDNCNCYAEPVYSETQVGDQELYELNRLYAYYWPIVTKGLGGKAALTAWRYFIRQKQKEASQVDAA